MRAARPTILIADDDAGNIDTLVACLADDYTLRTATDGAEALHCATAHPPDLILLDVMMPGLDGFAVCRRIKETASLQGIPVIFLTSLTDVGDEAMGLDLGAVDYVTKPFSMRIIKARVRNQLELKMHRSRLEELVAARTCELETAYRQLQGLDRLKNDFLRMISHEIRTPASAIFGFGDLIVDLLPASEEAREYVECFRNGSMRLLNLINDATLIANMETSQWGKASAASFATLFDQLALSVPEIQLTADPLAELESIPVQGDPALLVRALTTMVLLATRFSSERKKVHVGRRLGKNTLHLCIDLNGLSMSVQEASGFCEIGKLARCASAAEDMGLAPVVAQRILSAFGGDMRLVKGEGRSGRLEASLPCET